MSFSNAYRILSFVLVGFAISFATAGTAFGEIRWERSVEKAVASAQASGKPIVVYVATDWCHFCKIMDHETWPNADVGRIVNERYHALVLDGDRDREIVERLHLTGYPATLLYQPDGRYISHRSGHVSPIEMIDWLGNPIDTN